HPLSFNTHPLPSSLPISSFHCSRDHRDLHSFPTRRSSDLFWRIEEAAELVTQAEQRLVLTADGEATLRLLKRADALLSKELHSRSEEHTSELQSRFDLVCRLLLEKKKKNKNRTASKTNKVA